MQRSCVFTVYFPNNFLDNESNTFKTSVDTNSSGDISLFSNSTPNGICIGLSFLEVNSATADGVMFKYLPDLSEYTNAPVLFEFLNIPQAVSDVLGYPL